VNAEFENSEVYLDGMRRSKVPVFSENIQKGYHLLEIKNDNFHFKEEIATSSIPSFKPRFRE
jgi:hypothetical protein